MTGGSTSLEISESLARSEACSEVHRRQAFETGAWLKAIVETSDDAILSKTLDGKIMTWNSGAEKLFGYASEEAIGQSITMIIPEDRLHEEEAIIHELREGRRVQHFETIRRRKDGSLVDVALTVSPVKDENGVIFGASKIARDISTVKQASAQQDLIIREMNHRIKNLFALTTSLVALSARGAADVGELAEDLTARLRSLSRAHALTLPDLYADAATPNGTTLKILLQEVLAPHDDERGSRIAIGGDEVAVGPHAVPTLGLLFHELATNAAKYGALASLDGLLSIDITLRGDVVEIRWQEQGGPPRHAGQPASKGFGSRLEQASVGTLRGAIERIWKDAGLDIAIRFPVEQIAV